eukprot:Colp12_sorted_trinity150504_noHs@24762
MCLKCLKDPDLERGTTCLDGGSYMLNYNGCALCNSKGFVREVNRIAKEKNRKDGTSMETVTFEHMCADCDHIVAEHNYSFEVTSEQQEYIMTCDLCGIGSDIHNIMQGVKPVEPTN